MKRIALTGGFATGKSTVGRMLEDLGIPRIDADVLAHEITQPDRTAWRQIVAEFGEAVLLADRNLDRKKLADIVFASPEKRKRLEAIVHPKVKETMHQRIAELENRGSEKVLLEIPLLFEAGWDTEEPWDAIIVVTAAAHHQLERSRKKFGLTAKGSRDRIRAQLSIEEKIRKAGFVIENNSDLNSLKQEVTRLFRKLP